MEVGQGEDGKRRGHRSDGESERRVDKGQSKRIVRGLI